MHSLCKLQIDLEGREIEISVIPNAIATAEFGQIADGKRIAKHKVTVLVIPDQGGGIRAWTQVAAFSDQESMSIIAEGWLSSEGADGTHTQAKSPKGRVATVDGLTAHAQSFLEKVSIGTLSCCTSNGNGCYVKCCGSCCADPVGCPGASCCP